MKRGNILGQAHELTHGDRNKNYGSPLTNHERIASLWSTYLETQIRPDQVAICMALVKVARLIQTPDHLDSYIDGAAYMAIAGEIVSEDEGK
jgi:hypothetical protein